MGDNCFHMARDEMRRVERDVTEAKETLHRLHESEQTRGNLLRVLRDARSSLDTTYHLVALPDVDRKLRDCDLQDAHGVVFRYRGSEVGGLQMANTSGEFSHALRIVELTADGFLAERDHGPVERFTYRTRET